MIQTDKLYQKTKIFIQWLRNDFVNQNHYQCIISIINKLEIFIFRCVSEALITLIAFIIFVFSCNFDENIVNN